MLVWPQQLVKSEQSPVTPSGRGLTTMTWMFLTIPLSSPDPVSSGPASDDCGALATLLPPFRFRLPLLASSLPRFLGTSALGFPARPSLTPDRGGFNPNRRVDKRAKAPKLAADRRVLSKAASTERDGGAKGLQLLKNIKWCSVSGIDFFLHLHQARKIRSRDRPVCQVSTCQ